MTKRVVFAGGVQAKALAKAYRLDITLDQDEEVFFIGAEAIGRESARRVVGAADILVTDLTEAGPTVPEDMIQVGTLRIAVPVVTCDFLWPFSEKPHPRNARAPGLPEGPYPAGFGDSALDTFAADGLADDEILRRYLALDIAEEAELDDRLRRSLAVQARLDAQTGFDLADFISSRFRKQVLFASRDRPALPLFRHIASRLFGQMGVPPSRMALLADTYLGSSAMPIHPGVLRHFGMEVPAPDHLYPVLDEGYFSFGQYCRRYLRFEWNELLHAAIAKAETNPSAAIPQLRLALETSPESRAGQRALENAERAVSDASMLPPLALPPPSLTASHAAAAARPAVAPVPPPAPKATGGSDAVEKAAEILPEEARSAQAAPSPLRFPQPVRAPDATPRVAQEAEAGAEADADKQPASDSGQLAGIVPRAAFGSSLLARPPYVRDPDEAAAELDSSFVPLTQFGVGTRGRPEAASFSLGENETSIPLSMFPKSPTQMAPLIELAPDPDPVMDPASYVELPQTPGGRPEPVQSANTMPMTRTNRYTPLAPAEHLIPLLPRMLPNTRGMAGSVDKPFAAMPETLPPPPLRPVLPPELHPEPVKTSLMAKIMDQLRK